LRLLFERSGLRLSDLQVQQFWSFHQLLRRRNDELDLTRLHAFETIVIKHYVDCALVATLVDLPSPLLDLGSGAGFPGIPLKIVRPDVQVLLGEPRHKRVAFLEEAIRELGLQGIEVIPHRIGPQFDRKVRAVITRAVEPITDTLARVAPWLQPGAHVLFMKGPAVADEITAARRDWGEIFQVERDQRYTIAGTSHVRRLVMVERLATAAPSARRDEDSDAVADDLDAARAELDRWDANSEVASADTMPTAPPDAEPPSDGRERRDIASATNPTYKLLRAVLGGRGVRKHGRALLGGMRPILEVVRDAPDRARAWITSGATPAPPGNSPKTLAWYRMTPALFREIDVFGTGSPLLLLDVPPLEAWSDDTWPAGCTLFVPFQDPENVGAVIRTAAAFGVAQVVLLREAASPFHPRSARAAGSALLRVPLRGGPAIAELAPQGAPVLALSPGGRDIAEVGFPERFGLLVGLEGPGLPDAWRTAEAVGIPMQPGNESLNAAAATAVVLYLWSRGRGERTPLA
jgi:16S rRNA (guanine(527)-N(7))-methyltransferase RsmG